MRIAEAAARTHISQNQPASEDVLHLPAGALLFEGRVVALQVSAQDVHELADAGEQGHLPHDGGEPFAVHADLEMTFGILLYVHLRRIEAVALQEGEVPQGQVHAVVRHVADFLIGDDDAPHVLHLLAQQLGEALRIDGGVAVYESVFDLRARVGLHYIVLAGKGVKVVVSEVCDELSHFPKD